MPEVRVPMTIEKGHTSLKYASYSCRILSMRSKSLVYYLFCIVLNLLFLYINFYSFLFVFFGKFVMFSFVSYIFFIHFSHHTVLQSSCKASFFCILLLFNSVYYSWARCHSLFRSPLQLKS